MSTYKLTEKIREQFLPAVKEFILDIESGENKYADFSGTELNPLTLMLLLEELGYKRKDVNINGAEVEWWIKMTFENAKDIKIYGDGITFELTLSPCEYDKH